MNNAIGNGIFSRKGRLNNQPNLQFSIEHNHSSGIRFTSESQVAISDVTCENETYLVPGVRSKFETNPLPIGIVAFSAFKEMVALESSLSNSCFLIEMRLNEINCAFLTNEYRRDLTIDCLKEVIGIGLSEKAFSFSPSDRIWLLYTNVSADSAINKAKLAFLQVQKSLRKELDFHQSLVDLHLYKLANCMPDIY